MESVRNALSLRGALWVNKCKNGFKKRCLYCSYLVIGVFNVINFRVKHNFLLPISEVLDFAVVLINSTFNSSIFYGSLAEITIDFVS